jgi:hypothetical protein
MARNSAGQDQFFMVLIVDFTAAEIVRGDAGYRAEQIIDQIRAIGGVEDVARAGEVHEREGE